MKSPQPKIILAITATIFTLQFHLAAQSNAPVIVTDAPEVHPNTAIIPVPRTDWATNRQALVLKRAKDAPGDYDIEFIGDSITAGLGRSR